MPTDAFGGGDGFIVGKDAPPETVDFLGFLTNVENQRTWGRERNSREHRGHRRHHRDPAADGPVMQTVLDELTSATFMQLFLDQFFTAEVGARVNDQTALLFLDARGRRSGDHGDSRRLTHRRMIANVVGALASHLTRPDAVTTRPPSICAPPAASPAPPPGAARPASRSRVRGISGRRSSSSCFRRSPSTHAFVVYPIVQSTRYSLYDWNGLEPLTDFVGIDNFRRAFSDHLFRDALRHNGIIIGLSLLLQIPFALGLAMLLNVKLPGRACCARCSSPRTSCPRSSPPSCGARSCDPTACSTRPHGDRRRGADPRMARQPRHRPSTACSS